MPFPSHDDIFRAIRALIDAFERGGTSSAAHELHSGLAALNGLTDGWAALPDAVRRVERRHALRLDEPHRALLGDVHRAVYTSVYRRAPGPWRKFR